jgi:hypothetical protein
MDEMTAMDQVDRVVQGAGEIIEHGLRQAIDFDAGLSAVYAEASSRDAGLLAAGRVPALPPVVAKQTTRDVFGQGLASERGAVEFRLLGRVEAYSDGDRISLGAAKQRGMLGVLLYHEAYSATAL